MFELAGLNSAMHRQCYANADMYILATDGNKQACVSKLALVSPTKKHVKHFLWTFVHTFIYKGQQPPPTPNHSLPNYVAFPNISLLKEASRPITHDSRLAGATVSLRDSDTCWSTVSRPAPPVEVHYGYHPPAHAWSDGCCTSSQIGLGGTRSGIRMILMTTAQHR